MKIFIKLQKQTFETSIRLFKKIFYIYNLDLDIFFFLSQYMV